VRELLYVEVEPVWNVVRYREDFGPGNRTDKENSSVRIPSIYLK